MPGHISIKTRLVLSYVLASTTILVALFFAVDTWYANEQHNALDTFLETEGHGIVNTVGAYFDLSDMPFTGAKLDNVTHSKDFTDFLEDFLRKRLDRPLPYKTTLSIFDRKDNVLVQSNEALNLDIQDLNDLAAKFADLRGKQGGVTFQSVHTGTLEYRMVTLPVLVVNRTACIVRLACLLNPVQKVINDFTLSAVLFLFGMVVVNSVGSVLLTTLILRPMVTMTRKVDRITARNLDSRLDTLPGTDEFSHLALTLNRTLDRIESAWAYQSQLVNDLSHQLRTPLTALRGSIDVALGEPRTSAEYRDVLESSLSDIDRITVFLNTMLELARLDGHEVRLLRKPTDLVALVNETIDDLSPLWEIKDIQVKVVKDRSAGSVEMYANVDVFQIRQALMNILSNGYKYTPRHGHIRVDLSILKEAFGDQINITIRNDGPPIPEEALDHIFDRFFHADMGTTADRSSEGIDDGSAGPGFGLGLSIARRILELHEGTIRAWNPETGGVAFSLCIARLAQTTGVATGFSAAEPEP